MPWKMIISIVLLALFFCFIGFNLDNTCTINLVFFETPNVPVFIALPVAFLIGAAVALLMHFVLYTWKPSRKAKKEKKKTGKSVITPEAKEILKRAQKKDNDESED